MAEISTQILRDYDIRVLMAKAYLMPQPMKLALG
jgi:hypothetical protein